MTCPQVSDEGLICTLTPDHLGLHADQTDPSTEIRWAQSRPRSIPLGELVADVDEKVRARAGALLAQASPTLLRGHKATITIVDELLEPTYAEDAVDLPALVAPVRPPGVFADAIRKFFPGRRPSPGARRTGT